MSKKKILIFIDWYLPGYKAGGPIRSCSNMVSHFSNEFDFFIATRDTDYMDSVSYSNVKQNRWNQSADGSRVFYISKENLNKKNLKKIIADVNPDIVYLNGIFSYFFTILPLKIMDRKKIKMIVAVRGMFAPGALAIKPIKKKIFFLYAKAIGLFRDVVFQASSAEEKEQTKKIFPASRVVVVSNLSRKNYTTANNKIAKASGELRLLNIARVAPEKNLLVALQILKNIKGNVVFDFYGPVYDSVYWGKCRKFIDELPSNIKAAYNGVAKEDDIFNIMERYHFLFMPSLGENFGHIILESFSYGTPVIISSNTPWKNLSILQAGWDISLTNPGEFVQVIEKCVAMDNTEYQLYTKGAMQLAMGYINDEEKLNTTRKLFS